MGFFPLLLAYAAFGKARSPQVVSLLPIPNGEVSRIGRFWPVLLKVQKGLGDAKSVPPGLLSPGYGEITIQGKKYGVIVDRPDDGDYKVFVDLNQDGDYTNDPPIILEKLTQTYGPHSAAYRWFRGSFQVEVQLAGRPTSVRYFFYAFDKRDPNRGDAKDHVFYYPDFALEGTVQFGPTSFPIVLTDPAADASKPDADGLRMFFGRTNDGHFSRPEEQFDPSEPFSLGGQTMKVAEVSFRDGTITFDKSKANVSETQLVRPVHKGDSAPPFAAKTIDGKPIAFPDQFRKKLVLLHFWGTYFERSIQEIRPISQAYEKYQAKGFDVVSVDFDYPNTAKDFSTVKSANRMVWAHIRDREWTYPIAKKYSIPGLPYMFLVDGNTGKILAEYDDLKGDKLVAFLAKYFDK